MFRIAIIGGNIGASALITLLRGDPSTDLVGVFEEKPDSPGAILAKKWDIPVFDEIQSLKTVNPELVINMPGDTVLSDQIRDIFENKVEVIEGIGTRFIWEIIEKHKRARGEVQKTIENLGAFFDVVSQVGAADVLEDSLVFILERALELTGIPAGSIALFNNGEMKLSVSRG